MKKATLASFLLRCVMCAFIVASAHALETEIDEDESFVAGMYIAILNRSPAPGGFVFWTDIVRGGKTYSYVANEMWNSAGAREVYPETLTTQEKVATVYRNVLNREPKEGGLNFWSSIWDDKGAAHTMIAMINHLLNWQPADPQNPTEEEQLGLLDQSLFQEKVVIGNYLAVEKQNNDLELARAAFAYLEQGNSLEDTQIFIEQEIELLIPREGVFAGPPVSGLSYQTETKSGTTGAGGEFSYIYGEVISFKLGGITLGESLANSIMSPSDLVPEAIGLADPKLTNILRLLQSLDDNCDVSDGIVLSSDVLDVAQTISVIDFSSLLGFEVDTGVADLLAAGGCGELVDAVSARQIHQYHLQDDMKPLLDTFATYTNDGDKQPSLVVDNQGNSFALFAGDESRNELLRAVIQFSDGETSLMTFDLDGFIDAIYFENGTILSLGNYTPTSVDVAVQGYADGTEDLAEAEVFRVSLGAFGTAYYNFIQSLDLTQGLDLMASSNLGHCADLDWSCYKETIVNIVARHSKTTLGKLIPAAIADDATQIIGEGLAVVSVGVKYSGEFRDIVEVIHNSSSGAAALSKWVNNASKKTMEDVLWKASLNALGLSKNEQQIANIVLNTTKCVQNTIYNYADCFEVFKDSAEAFLEAGQILWEIYQDRDRLEALKEAIEQQQAQLGQWPPVLTITSPTSQFKYPPDGNGTIELGATVIDANKDASPSDIEWYVGDVYIGSGPSLSLSTGHAAFSTPTIVVDDKEIFAIEADIADSSGRTDSQAFLVEIGNVPPNVEIPNFSHDPKVPNYLDCEDNYFVSTGKAFDEEDGEILDQSAFVWKVDGVVVAEGTSLANFQLSCPQSGNGNQYHEVRLEVTDSGNGTGVDSVLVQVTSGRPEILAIDGETYYKSGEQVVLTAEAELIDNSPAPSSSISWTARGHPHLGTSSVNGFKEVQQSGKEFSANLPDGLWYIYATVFDNGVADSEYVRVCIGDVCNLSGSYVVNVTVPPGCNPAYNGTYTLKLNNQSTSSPYIYAWQIPGITSGNTVASATQGVPIRFNFDDARIDLGVSLAGNVSYSIICRG